MSVSRFIPRGKAVVIVCKACGIRRRVLREEADAAIDDHKANLCPLRENRPKRAATDWNLPARALRLGRFCLACRDELAVAGDPTSCPSGCGEHAML
jgi:hypothetical protein